MTANHEVGYCNPPKASQFKKGQSGNPKGRPKGVQNLATVFCKVLGQKIRLTEQGKVRSVATLEAILIALRAQALRLDIKAIKLLFDLMAKHLPSAVSTAVQTLPAPFTWTDDDAKLAPYLEEIANGTPIAVEH